MAELVEETKTYLAGAGRHVARRLTIRYGLPPELIADLEQEALVAMHRAERRGAEIDDVSRYVNGVLRNATLGLVRGEIRRNRELLRAPLPSDDGDRTDPLEQLPAVEQPDLDVLAAIDLAELRTAVAARLAARSPHPAAGALALLVLADPADPATAADDCPQPRRGASEPRSASATGPPTRAGGGRGRSGPTAPCWPPPPSCPTTTTLSPACWSRRGRSARPPTTSPTTRARPACPTGCGPSPRPSTTVRARPEPSGSTTARSSSVVGASQPRRGPRPATRPAPPKRASTPKTSAGFVTEDASHPHC